MVPNLSPQNLVSVEIGKDFMLSHGYMKNDFDVKKWAAPEFLEQAAKELLEEQWKKTTEAKLPEATELLGSGQRPRLAGSRVPLAGRGLLDGRGERAVRLRRADPGARRRARFPVLSGPRPCRPGP
jgi:hypothetical protein